MRRLGTGERWWTAEIVVRALGAAMIALCAIAASWLCRAVQAAPQQGASLVDYGAALVTFLSWAVGGAFAIEGPALFKLVPTPPGALGRQILEIGDME